MMSELGQKEDRRWPLKILFLSEGNLGSGVMGHASAEAALRTGLAAVEGIEPRYRQLPPMAGLARLCARNVPVAGRLDLDLQTVRWHAVQSLRARSAITREVRLSQPDVLHVHSHTVAMGSVGHMRRIPTLLSLDSTVTDWESAGIWRRVRRHSGATIAPSLAGERRALGAAKLVLAWTDWARLRVQSEYPEIRVIQHHPGLDLERYRPAGYRPRALPRVLFVGGRLTQKGGRDLLASLGPLLGTKLELDLVTPAPVQATHGVRVHRLAAGDEALIRLYQQADVFCLPTYFDAAPWAVLEAMACGSPVVTSTVGGVPDLVEGGQVGVLVDPGKPRHLREAIEGLLGDDDRRMELRRRGRAHCERHYDARRQGSRLVDLAFDISDRRN